MKSLSYNYCHDKQDCVPEVYDDERITSHGTKCAGVIAMVANNKKCGVGVAYNAKITGHTYDI